MIDEVSRLALEALEADLRQAIQHRAAALERVAETQAELEVALRRGAALLGARPDDERVSPADAPVANPPGSPQGG